MSSILILLAGSQHNLYDIYLLLCIQYWTPDDGLKTCPKHVGFYSKNTTEKSAHLVGFFNKNVKFTFYLHPTGVWISRREVHSRLNTVIPLPVVVLFVESCIMLT
jgi:hypothetical protein